MKARFIVGVVFLWVVVAVIAVSVLQAIWNAAVVPYFGLKVIGWWQMLGLYAIGQIMFRAKVEVTKKG